MKRLLLALFLVGSASGESHRVVLLQESVRLEAMERRSIVMFPLAQQAAQLEVKFASTRGGEGVRILVFTAASNQELATSTYQLAGTFRTPLERQREYVIAVENQRQRLGHAVVDVEVALLFGARQEPAPAAQSLDPRRKLYTIVTSLTLFAMIVAYSAIRLTPPILQRWRGQR